jgi:hypothetical protein
LQREGNISTYPYILMRCNFSPFGIRCRGASENLTHWQQDAGQGEANGEGLFSPPDGWRRGRIRIRDLPLISPRDCARIAPDMRGKHGHCIGEETGKGHSGPYKRIISYQVIGMDRGGQSRGGDGDAHGGERGQERAGGQARSSMTGGQQDASASGPHRDKRLTYQRTDPHPTGGRATLLPAMTA